jgi:peptide/nickel transport system ATP-binding protein
MRDGALVEMGSPDEIFDSPKEEYTKNLIDAIPRRKPHGLDRFTG